ncbi:hypothetical protein GDO78_015773 [Eleutherodactylus coqui]|uniref:Uncharacterized protein n=1 Tax=Eleutherodactylus coqui TaxID=57060 RepID=A0A8J6JNS0_ELECQ|nr:hypothetical protein GDO78_015773 [Eleutherodactylus coqui]
MLTQLFSYQPMLTGSELFRATLPISGCLSNQSPYCVKVLVFFLSDFLVFYLCLNHPAFLTSTVLTSTCYLATLLPALVLNLIYVVKLFCLSRLALIYNYILLYTLCYKKPDQVSCLSTRLFLE